MEVMTLFSGDTMEILKSVKVWGLFPAIIILFITVFFLRFTRQSFDVLGPGNLHTGSLEIIELDTMDEVANLK